MLHHNKKRNVGLLNEFFARYIANQLLTQNHDGIKKAKELHSKYFSGNKILAKEWKFFQALYSTNVTSNEVANTLIERVRTFCSDGSLANLKLREAEKTRLIHEINTLGDKDFFSRAVPDYKIQATIQVLINNWNTGAITESLSEISQLEENLFRHLTRIKEAHEGDASYLEMTNEEIDGLVVNIMSEKFNTKFGNELSSEQRDIISNYVFCQNEDSRAKLISSLEGVRTRTLNLVEKAILDKKAGKEDIGAPLLKKLNGVKNLLLNEYKNTSNLTDESVTFFMTLTDFEKELS